MKQKELTKEQVEICKKINALLEEANAHGIEFLFDNEDCSITAFNADGVVMCYTNGTPDDVEKIDWDKCYTFDSNLYSYDSNYESFYLAY